MRLLSRQAGADPETERVAHLGRLRTQMVLEGGYQSVRQFLYELETTPEFIIVDDVSLGQAESNRPVTLTVEVSTYYRLDRNGT
jgi:Type II secretion system (T2SS), protein M subtype b